MKLTNYQIGRLHLVLQETLRVMRNQDMNREELTNALFEMYSEFDSLFTVRELEKIAGDLKEVYNRDNMVELTEIKG